MSTEKNELEPSEDHIIAPPIFGVVLVAVAVAVAAAAVAKIPKGAQPAFIFSFGGCRFGLHGPLWPARRKQICSARRPANSLGCAFW